MDHIQRHFYQREFEVRFLRDKGAAFESLFRSIMEARFPGDFVAVHPHGKLGDLKCDGYQTSTRRVFQSYAPKEMKLKALSAKMKADFNGAVTEWGGSHMDQWVLVHNDDGGLPAPALKLLLDMGQLHQGISVAQWSYPELLTLVLEIPLERLEVLFGAAPTWGQIAMVTSAEIAVAIRGIQGFNPHISLDHVPIPPVAKLTSNGLSASVIELIRGGLMGAERVGMFFDRHPEPNFGATVAAAFQKEYVTARDAGMAPDQIYDRLYKLAGGEGAGANRRAAVLAVLAYLFERCDIFEAPVVVP